MCMEDDRRIREEAEEAERLAGEKAVRSVEAMSGRPSAACGLGSGATVQRTVAWKASASASMHPR